MAIAASKSIKELNDLETWVDRFQDTPHQETVEGAWLDRYRSLKRKR